jgi:hypothetical protein
MFPPIIIFPEAPLGGCPGIPGFQQGKATGRATFMLDLRPVRGETWAPVSQICVEPTK